MFPVSKFGGSNAIPVFIAAVSNTCPVFYEPLQTFLVSACRVNIIPVLNAARSHTLII
jgi:hypothetical protein